MTRPPAIYKHFEEFAQASACAKDAARLFATWTAVKWHKIYWIVLIPIGEGFQLHADADADLGLHAAYEDAFAEMNEFNDSALGAPSPEAMSSDQDYWARAEEEGRHYNDDDCMRRSYPKELSIPRRHYHSFAQHDRRCPQPESKSRQECRRRHFHCRG